MGQDEKEDPTRYAVVVNHEEQYSIWPDDKAVPHGWRPAGKSGSKAECLSWVRENWRDMTPLSLRSRNTEG